MKNETYPYSVLFLSVFFGFISGICFTHY